MPCQQPLNKKSRADKRISRQRRVVKRRYLIAVRAQQSAASLQSSRNRDTQSERRVRCLKRSPPTPTQKTHNSRKRHSIVHNAANQRRSEVSVWVYFQGATATVAVRDMACVVSPPRLTRGEVRRILSHDRLDRRALSGIPPQIGCRNDHGHDRTEGRTLPTLNSIGPNQNNVVRSNHIGLDRSVCSEKLR